MKKIRVARIMEVGPYPPPLAGWSIRIRFVKDKINELGHECRVLNIGKSRKIPSDQYVTVRNRFDYVVKSFYYAAKGYTHHMHTNGDGPVGFMLSLISAVAGFVCGRRIVLSLHAGTQQRYFPRSRSRMFLPVLYLLFHLPKMVICNNEAVKQKIVEYGVRPEKIVPIRAFGSSYLVSEEVQLPDDTEVFLERCDPVIFTYVFFREGFYLDTLVEGMRRLTDEYPDIGLVVAGSLDDNEPAVKTRIMDKITAAGIGDHFCFAGDLTHDQFITALRRSKLYLRTPTSDGECTSVLESLTEKIPVVAADNHNRPSGVVTYQADDPAEMCQRVCEVLSDQQYFIDEISIPEASDTVTETAEVLIAAALGKSRKSSP